MANGQSFEEFINRRSQVFSDILQTLDAYEKVILDKRNNQFQQDLNNTEDPAKRLELILLRLESQQGDMQFFMSQIVRCISLFATTQTQVALMEKGGFEAVIDNLPSNSMFR